MSIKIRWVNDGATTITYMCSRMPCILPAATTTWATEAAELGAVIAEVGVSISVERLLIEAISFTIGIDLPFLVTP